MSNYSAEDTERDIEKIFRLYDFEQKGYIDEEDLRRVADIVGEPMNYD
jgi:Ca2+-binding EF-hand superfamily protein